MRVVIAEDAALLREGLTRLLEDRGHAICAAVPDGDALLAAVAEHRPDVAVVDIRMPPTHTDEGLRAALKLRHDFPRHRRPGVLPVHRDLLQRAAARGRRGRGRLPAQGPGRERGRVHRGAAAGGGRRDRPGPGGGQPAVPGQPAARRPGHADPAGAPGAGADGRGQVERRASPPSWWSRAGRWRSTSPASSPSSACRRTRATTAACWPCSATLGENRSSKTGDSRVTGTASYLCLECPAVLRLDSSYSWANHD